MTKLPAFRDGPASARASLLLQVSGPFAVSITSYLTSPAIGKFPTRAGPGGSSACHEPPDPAASRDEIRRSTEDRVIAFR